MTNIENDFNIDWVFTFGKHKGCTLGDVSGNGGTWDYVYWCYKNIEWFRIEMDDNPALLNTMKQRYRIRYRIRY